MNEDAVCLMCNKPGAVGPHLYPGPLRGWCYAPLEPESFDVGGTVVRLKASEPVLLHTPCVGSFVVMNRDKNLLVFLEPE